MSKEKVILWINGHRHEVPVGDTMMVTATVNVEGGERNGPRAAGSIAVTVPVWVEGVK